MFKGLRTKIECEQRGQKLPYTEKIQGSEKPRSRSDQTENVNLPNESKSDEIYYANSNQSTEKFALEVDHQREELLNKLETEQSRATVSCHEDILDDQTSNSISKLKDELFAAKHHLQSVIRERDENIKQNARLSQLVEELKKNLESEKETNASLRSKLDESVALLEDRNDYIKNLRGGDASTIAYTRTLEALMPIDKTTSDDDAPDLVQSLRQQIEQLQNQLSEKTRQIKIRQQNTNDIKKTLQKEMIDHSKTQKELSDLQEQFKQLQLQSQFSAPTRDSSSMLNGSNKSDSNLNQKTHLNQISDRQHDSSSSHDGSDSPNVGQQLESMSNLSKSGASVEDFDSNDLQHNDSKEVNYEYLKNVLYRYMTSTETETAQHLVKAISVLMNFSPEQSAAVKSAIHSKSSWLRLK